MIMTTVDSVSFEARLKRAFKAGQSSSLQGLTREPPYGDTDLDLSWVCGFDATQREIEEFEDA
jgi:hypothetical protein